jgi:hypothetical protein
VDLASPVVEFRLWGGDLVEHAASTYLIGGQGEEPRMDWESIDLRDVEGVEDGTADPSEIRRAVERSMAGASSEAVEEALAVVMAMAGHGDPDLFTPIDVVYSEKDGWVTVDLPKAKATCAARRSRWWRRPRTSRR